MNPTATAPPDSKKKITRLLSILIGGLLAIVLVFIGFKLVQGVFTKASDSAPRDVAIIAKTQNTAKITWTTDQETQGVIEYGSSPTSLSFFAPEAQKGKKHSADLTLLSPNTMYYFHIRIGDQKHDNGGVPWQFTTDGKKSDSASADESPTSATGSPTIVVTPPGAVDETGPLVRPTSVLVVNPPNTPVPLPTLASFVCGSTDCITICQKLNKTCSSQEWFKSGCVGKVNPLTCTQVVPTNTPTPTAVATSTPTPTPTSTPTPTPTPTPTSTPTPTPTS